MFTGIVEELGTVEAVEDQGDAIRLTVARRAPCSRTPALGDSISVNGCCLTVAERDRRHLDRRRHAGDARQDLAARRAARRPGQPRARRHRRQAARRPHRPGPRRRRRHRRPAYPQRALGGRRDLDARRSSAATSSTRARSPSTGSASPSSRPATTRFTVSLIPETLARTTLGYPAARRPGQPRGRRHRQARREADHRRLRRPAPAAHRRRTPMTDPAVTRFASTPSSGRSPTSPPARPSSSSTTRTARTRATSSSPPPRRPRS